MTTIVMEREDNKAQALTAGEAASIRVKSGIPGETDYTVTVKEP